MEKWWGALITEEMLCGYDDLVRRGRDLLGFSLYSIGLTGEKLIQKVGVDIPFDKVGVVDDL